MENCIFCKIVDKKIPSHVIYEDEEFLAFLDVHPASVGHTLVIPKKHCDNILKAEDDILSKMLIVVKNIAHMLTKKLEANGINILNNCGKVAGQTCFHLHIHIIPRFDEKDGFKPEFSKSFTPCLTINEVYQKLIQ